MKTERMQQLRTAIQNSKGRRMQKAEDVERNREAVAELRERLRGRFSGLGFYCRFYECTDTPIRGLDEPEMFEKYWLATLVLELDDYTFQMPMEFALNEGKFCVKGRIFHCDEDRLIDLVVDTCILKVSKSSGESSHLLIGPRSI